MKPTGIVRRMDDLGRLVIPKEIRRIFKINEGDPMEFYATKYGVLIKKYSALDVLHEIADYYSDVLFEETSIPVVITDCEKVISVSGLDDITIGSEISDSLYNYIINGKQSERRMKFLTDHKYTAGLLEIIESSGNSIGSIIFIETNSISIGEREIQCAKITASLLSRQAVIL